MTAVCPIAEFAHAVFPLSDPNGAIAVLWGYFDESGTDGRLGHTTISGFVSTADEWSALRTEWRNALDRKGIGTFHYHHCKRQKNEYEGWDWFNDCVPHLDKMANIIAYGTVYPVSASYSGDYDALIAKFPERRDRYPTAYSVLFEMVISMIIDHVHVRWTEKAAAVIFSQHKQFGPAAQKIYDYHKYNGLWPEICHFGYSDPNRVEPLQMADMFAWEIRRYLWGKDPKEAHPLLNSLFREERINRGDPYALGFGDDHLIQFFQAPLGEELKPPPGYS